MDPNFNDYDYVIVGAGWFGCTIAERIANDLGKRVLIIEKRDHIGGNCYTKNDEKTGINYHVYGPHLFHTSNERVWKYVNSFVEFGQYNHQVYSSVDGRTYNFPMNLKTINDFFGVDLKPGEVAAFLESKRVKNDNPQNFEEKAISMVGTEIYNAFFKEYTEKQWGKDPKTLPAAIFSRLPIRFNYQNSYYNDKYTGLPPNGYTEVFEKMLENKRIHLITEIDFFQFKHKIRTKIIYTGPIDKYFNYCYGKLEYRSLEFKIEYYDIPDFQGIQVMNYPQKKFPFTRITEPKHFYPDKYKDVKTTMTIKEFPNDNPEEPYYPIGDEKNQEMYKKYRKLADKELNVIIGGRLGSYKYFDQDDTIEDALNIYDTKICQKEFTNTNHDQKKQE